VSISLETAKIITAGVRAAAHELAAISGIESASLVPQPD
jgi:hypothetical protein